MVNSLILGNDSSSNSGLLPTNEQQVDLSEIKSKIQNIDLNNTTAGVTNFTGEIKINNQDFNVDSTQDFSGINGSQKKINTTTDLSQDCEGNIVQYTLSTACSLGQPLISDYTAGVITAKAITSLPSSAKIIGISLETKNSNETVKILKNGYCTSRCTSTFQTSSETVLLNNTTNGTMNQLTNNTTFRDSGNNNDYSSNENYSIVFDAGENNTVNIQVNDFNFEHTTSQMYDRFGYQTSNDNITYTNASVEWLQKSSTSTPPYSNSYAGSSWQSSQSKNGYIFPSNTTRALLLEGVPNNQFPAMINTGSRYVKFYFKSDSSSTETGWDLNLSPSTPYNTEAEDVPIDTPLYLDSTDFTKITTNSSSGILLGNCAYPDASNDSVFMYVNRY